MEGGDDDDEGGFGGLYENGHWAWDDATGEIIFLKDLSSMVLETAQLTTKTPTGTVEFRDDVDLIEQIRFRRRYQRKLKQGQSDVISLQDVKDVAIYTAPVTILSSSLISMLHLTTTERFLRALILYCAYYLQIADEMANRILQQDIKVRTPVCDTIEHEFRDNLEDLRILVAKEYATMLIGGDDTKKFHHMGPQKKRRSLSDKDARFFETLLRMAIQIVWLALGRKSFNQIELEVHRMFKTDIFNSAEHNLKTGYMGKMEKEEHSVLFGHCIRPGAKKLNIRSPLMNEVFCHRPIDYRLMSLGVIKMPQATSRLKYMLYAVAGPEDMLVDKNVALGIIGMPRARFDTMLRSLPTASEGKSKVSISSASVYSSKGSSGSRKSQMLTTKLYPDVELPRKGAKALHLPGVFPSEREDRLPVSEVQHRRWQNRLKKLMNPGR